MDIPRLETKRLLLREWSLADFDAYAAIFADPVVMRFLGPVMDRIEAWRRLAGVIGQWTLRGYGRWAVTRKEDGALLGVVGLNHPEAWPGPEVAWTLGRPYWGKGYATEAARAAMAYGFRNHDFGELISLIDPANTSSQGVAKRLGETKGEPYKFHFDGKAYPTDIWSISRAEWLSRENAA